VFVELYCKIWTRKCKVGATSTE